MQANKMNAHLSKCGHYVESHSTVIHSELKEKLHTLMPLWHVMAWKVYIFPFRKHEMADTCNWT